MEYLPLEAPKGYAIGRMNREICVLVHIETIEKDGQFRTELAEKGDLYVTSHHD